MLDFRDEDWMDQGIPALGGRTPREAVTDADGRARVEVIVREIERSGAQMTPPLDESIPRRLREQLGLSVG